MLEENLIRNFLSQVIFFVMERLVIRFHELRRHRMWLLVFRQSCDFLLFFELLLRSFCFKNLGSKAYKRILLISLRILFFFNFFERRCQLRCSIIRFWSGSMYFLFISSHLHEYLNGIFWSCSIKLWERRRDHEKLLFTVEFITFALLLFFEYSIASLNSASFFITPQNTLGSLILNF